MKVFAPTRVVGTSYRPDFAVGIPLEGDWIDIPDYFRQVTHKGEINDVVHAKVVDPYGNRYYLWDQSLAFGYNQTEICQFSQRWGEFPFCGWSFGTFTVDEEWVELAPSPNYKGKNKRKRFKQARVKNMHPFCVCANLNSWGDSPEYGRNPAGEYGAFGGTLYCYALPELLPELRTGVPVPAGAVVGMRYEIRHKWTPGQTTPDYWVESADGSPVPTVLQLFALKLMGETLINDRYKFIERGKWEKRLTNDLYNSLLGAGPEMLHHLRAYGTPSSYGGVCQNYAFWTCKAVSAPVPEMDLSQAFLLNEPYTIGDKIDPLLLGANGGLADYWLDYACQHAIKEACESLPRLSDNSISNLIELVGFVKGIVVDHKIEMPKSLADAWLAYRYQYSTTKLDIEDAIKFVHRHMDLGTLDRQIVGRSTFNFDYKDVPITCRAQLESTPKHISKFKDIWRALATYGLTPDFYVIWDMIPYSFMVDWFLPVSDIASVWDANALYFSGEYYDLSNLCYSLKYVRELNGYNVQCYTRWAGSVPSSLNSVYWYDAPSVSSKTVGKRVLDAASIFIGR